MTILITGAAGFIGFHLCKKLIEKKMNVIAIDNINNYYSQKLKRDRINLLLKNKNKKFLNFKKLDIKDKNKLSNFLKNKKIDVIVHLAAQAGIRYSLKNPRDYLNNNIIGLFNIMEIARNKKLKKLIYASSSSIYGNSSKTPFSEDFDTSSPLQFYGSTKKAGEVFLKTYNYLYGFPVICLRFFTVYGPWGRPDMAIFSFTERIINNEKINIFNNGKMLRDFTYIDDVVDGIIKSIKLKKNGFKIYNIGNQKPVKLMTIIKIIEKNLRKKAIINFTNYKKTEMLKTHSNNKRALKDIKYMPKIEIEKGIKKFIDWFKNYYGK